MTEETATVQHVYEPIGAIREAFYARDREVLLSGAAGTGKTRGLLEKVHALALTFPNSRILLVRKTQEDLLKSAMVEFRESVVADALESGEVKWYGGSSRESAAFNYANGSVVLSSGMDKSSKVKSMQLDVIYVNEATELTEEDWELLLSRLRNGKIPFQQIIADCNPEAPYHWLKHRCDSGKTKMIFTRHEDNPIFYTDNQWTQRGLEYLETLDSLTGVRKARLRYGQWTAAEGLVYEEYDEKIHLMNKTVTFGQGDISEKEKSRWTWYFGVDFGWDHPFVCQMWAVDDDGRMYLYREVYHSNKTVEELAADIKAAMAPKLNGSYAIPRPKAVICDHADPEKMQQLRKHLGFNVVKANKDVMAGINLVKERLKVAGDGKPRLFVCRNATYQIDKRLQDKKKPVSTAQEFLGYVWDDRKDAPVKKDDDGMDAMRYVVAHLDAAPKPRIRTFTY